MADGVKAIAFMAGAAAIAVVSSALTYAAVRSASGSPAPGAAAAAAAAAVAAPAESARADDDDDDDEEGHAKGNDEVALAAAIRRQQQLHQLKRKDTGSVPGSTTTSRVSSSTELAAAPKTARQHGGLTATTTVPTGQPGTVTKLAGSSGKKKPVETWNDVELPASGKMRKQHAPVVDEAVFDDFDAIDITPKQPQPVQQQQQQPQPSKLQLAQQQHQKLNIYREGSRGKYVARAPIASSTTSTSSNQSGDESFDDLVFPEGPLTLKVHGNNDDDDFGFESVDTSLISSSRLPQHRKHGQISPPQLSSRGEPAVPAKTSTLPNHLARLRSQTVEHIPDNDAATFGVEISAAKLQQGFRKVQSTGRELDGLDVVGDGGRDFSPASINKLKDKTARVPAGSLGERYVRPSNDYGDGSELDAIEDFPGSVPTQLKPTTPSSHRRSKHHRSHKGPALIREMGPKTPKVVGEMVFDSVNKVWVGNSSALDDFEKATPTRPALISNLGMPTPKVVNGMVFDPDRMCWIGNDQDGAKLEGLMFDASSTQTSATSSTRGTDKSVFNLSPEYLERLRASEQAHRRLMRDFDPRRHIREHLYHIREIANKIVDQ